MFKNIIYLKNQNIYNLFETTNKNNEQRTKVRLQILFALNRQKNITVIKLINRILNDVYIINLISNL